MTKGQQIVIANLRRMLGSCPVCNQNFTSHLYTRFAITIFTRERQHRIAEFLKALREHRWRDVMEFNEFDGMEDALVAHALRCGGRQIVWLVIREPYELGDSPTLVEQEILNLENSREIESLISQDSWVSLEF